MPTEQPSPTQEAELLESGDDEFSSSPDSNSSSGKRHLLDILFYVAIAAIAPVAARILSVIPRMMGIWWKQPSYYIEGALTSIVSSSTLQMFIFSLVLAFIFISVRWINNKEERVGFPPLAILAGVIAYPVGFVSGALLGAVLDIGGNFWTELVALHISGALFAGLAAKVVMFLRFQTPPKYKRELFVWGSSLFALLVTIALNPTSNFPSHKDDKTRLAWAKENMGDLFPALEERLLATPALERFAGKNARLDVTKDGYMTLHPSELWEHLDGRITVVGERGQIDCDFGISKDHEEKEPGDDHITCYAPSFSLQIDPVNGEVIGASSYSYTNRDRRWHMRHIEPELEHIQKSLAALPWLTEHAGAFEPKDIALPRGDAFRGDHIKPFDDLFAITVVVPGDRRELICRVGIHWDDYSGARDIVECWSGQTGRMVYFSGTATLHDLRAHPIANPDSEDRNPLFVAPGTYPAQPYGSEESPAGPGSSRPERGRFEK